MRLIRAIVNGDAPTAVEPIDSSPFLARESLAVGATREAARDFYFQGVEHYFVSGDTLPHAAAATGRVLLRNFLSAARTLPLQSKRSSAIASCC